MAFRRLAAVLVALVCLAGLGACGDSGSDAGSNTDTGTGSTGGDGGGDEPATNAAATVELLPTTFEPDEVSVKVGETVLWRWQGGVQHNVNGGDAFKSKLLTNGRFEHTFAEAGEYPYRCDVHPTTMTGKVTVT